MSFDAYLLLGAAASQLALTVMGIIFALRPPKPEHHWRIVGAFFVAGFIGCGAVFWIGLRASHDQGAVSSGLVSIQSGQDKIARRLDDLAPVKAAPEPGPIPPVEKTTSPKKPAENTPREPGKGNSRLAIVQLPFSPADPNNSNGDQIMKVEFENKGDIRAISPAISYQWRIVDALLDDKDTAAFVDAVSNAAYTDQIFEPDRPEIEFGQQYTKTGGEIRISAADFQAMKDKTKFLYVFCGLAYPDISLKPKEYWLTVFGAYIQGDINQYTTIRSRTRLRRAP